jgi:AhpD family alkylhydroperoxidase
METNMSKLPGAYRRFKDEHPDTWQAFNRLGEAASNEGPLEPKVRELIKLGMAAAAHSESGVWSHAHRALDAGATPAEIEHAIILGVTTLGFPAMMAALTWAKKAMEDHS